MRKIKILRNSLMLSQTEVGECLGLSQCVVSDNEIGVIDYHEQEIEEALSKPSIDLLKQLIRLAKFAHLAKDYNQTEFAEKTGLSQGAVSLFRRARRKITDERWEGILGRLGTEEPPTSDFFVKKAMDIFERNRVDEGYHLQRRLEELGLTPSQLAEGIGVGRSTVTYYLTCNKFTDEVRNRIEKWFTEVL